MLLRKSRTSFSDNARYTRLRRKIGLGLAQRLVLVLFEVAEERRCISARHYSL